MSQFIINSNNQAYKNYVIQNVILVESHFKRTPDAPDGDVSEIHFDVNSNVNPKTDIVNVTVELSIVISFKKNGLSLVDITVIMVGIFSRDERPPQEEELLFINGHALNIIYPYTKEYVSGIIRRAGLAPIKLPFMDFVDMYLSNDNKSDQQIYNG